MKKDKQCLSSLKMRKTDPQLFVAKYELQLPSKDKIQEFLMKENSLIR